MKPKKRTPTPSRLLMAQRFQMPASPATDATPPPAPPVGAPAGTAGSTLTAGPLIPPTASIWQMYGSVIAARPMNDWYALLATVPEFNRPVIVYGLCRQALSDVFDDAGFAVWWKSELDELGGESPAAMVKNKKSSWLMEIVLDWVARGEA